MADLDPALTAFLNSPDPAAALAAYDQAGPDLYDPAQSDLAGLSIGGPQGIVVGGNTSLARQLGKGVRMIGAAIKFIGKSGDVFSLVSTIAGLVGVDAKTLASAFLAKRGRRRRGRGITYRQLANARRVNNTIDRMYHQLHKGQHHRAPTYRVQPAAFHRRRLRAVK